MNNILTKDRAKTVIGGGLKARWQSCLPGHRGPTNILGHNLSRVIGDSTYDKLFSRKN